MKLCHVETWMDLEIVIQSEMSKEKQTSYTNIYKSYVSGLNQGENHKDATRKLLELINGISRDARYKINLQKSVAFYILTIKYQKQKIREQSHLPSHQKE